MLPSMAWPTRRQTRPNIGCCSPRGDTLGALSFQVMRSSREDGNMFPKPMRFRRDICSVGVGKGGADEQDCRSRQWPLDPDERIPSCGAILSSRGIRFSDNMQRSSKAPGRIVAGPRIGAEMAAGIDLTTTSGSCARDGMSRVFLDSNYSFTN